MSTSPHPAPPAAPAGAGSPVPADLRSAALEQLPLGSVRPAGWLGDQLQAQVDGMAGHLHEFWPPVRDSAWIGGSDEGWERGPYWLDGVVGLAHLTGDARLLGEVQRWVEHLLAHQHADGWMAPDRPAGTEDGNTAAGADDGDPWPRMVLMKALLAHHGATGDPRIPPALVRLALRIGEVVTVTPVRDWARYRAHDLSWSLLRLHALTGDDRLLDVARLLLRQGYPWEGFAAVMPTAKVSAGDLARWEAEHTGEEIFPEPQMTAHGVNIAMGLARMPAAHLLGDDGARQSLHELLTALDRHHGQAHGLYSCDEHLAGRHPSQGVETCTVVEALHSLEVATLAFGVDEGLLQRWERIALNALPAAATAADDAHQYDQQVNQVVCHVMQDRIWTTNGPESNLFGLEPHFGCCTANRHQGWPRYVAHQWLRDPGDGGLVAVGYAPVVLDDGDLHVEVGGEHPFTDEVSIDVTARSADDDGRPVHLRVPGWAQEPTLAVDGGPARPLEPGTVVTLRGPWSAGTTRIRLLLPAVVRARSTTGEPATTSAVVDRGPLVLVLPVTEEWVPLRTTGPVTDSEVHPRSAWERGLVDGPDGPSLRLERTGATGPVFSPDGARIGVRTTVRRVPGWHLDRGSAAAPPLGRIGSGPEHEVLLLPYGAARLRVGVLPLVDPAPPTADRADGPGPTHDVRA